MEPERRDLDRSTPERTPLSSAERGRVVRAAALRPLNVVVLAIGAGIFATTLAWWMVPLTLVTYALLVFFASRDPLLAPPRLSPGAEAGLLAPPPHPGGSP